MDEKRLKLLREYRTQYAFAMSICDPIEFAKRQQQLLYATAQVIIQELNDYENEMLLKENTHE